jgi:hypothetical protein
MKKTMALMVGFLILGFAFAAGQEKTQTQTQAKAQVQTELKAQAKAQANVQTKAEFRHRNRIAFVDENGDGINDLAKDADGDGIPNGQDPDWVKPGDGTGYKAQHKIGKGSFRTGTMAAGRASRTGSSIGWVRTRRFGPMSGLLPRPIRTSPPS